MANLEQFSIPNADLLDEAPAAPTPAASVAASEAANNNTVYAEAKSSSGESPYQQDGSSSVGASSDSKQTPYQQQTPNAAPAALSSSSSSSAAAASVATLPAFSSLLSPSDAPAAAASVSATPASPSASASVSASASDPASVAAASVSSAAAASSSSSPSAAAQRPAPQVQPMVHPQQGQMGTTLCPYCSLRIAYPLGAQFIMCPGCRLTSRLQLMPTLVVPCRQCRTLLAYTANYALIQCPRCKTLVDPRRPFETPRMPVRQTNSMVYPGAAGSRGPGYASASPTSAKPASPAAGTASASLGSRIEQKREAEQKRGGEFELQPMPTRSSAQPGSDAGGNKSKSKSEGPESSWTNLLSTAPAEPQYGRLDDEG